MQARIHKNQQAVNCFDMAKKSIIPLYFFVLELTSIYLETTAN